MTRPLTQPEKLIFGEDADVHPVTDLPLQRGYGAADADKQAVDWHLSVFQQQRDQTTSKIADLDRAIAANGNNAGHVEFLRRQRNALSVELERLDKWIHDVRIGLLASGAIERVRGQAFADEMHAALLHDEASA